MAKPNHKPIGHFPRKTELPDPFCPCNDSTLAASSRNIANLAEPEYWAAICPELTVNGQLKGAKPLIKPEEFKSGLKQQINDEGVFQVHPGDMKWTVNIHRLARNMVTLMQHGWPATFLLMYDEVWALIQRASELMAATTGNACNMDVLCWYVDPNRGDAGFSPHRDRQPDDAPATFRPDGSPMYSTCWVPLTDACPENSCLYVVPRWADPCYFDGDDDDGPDPLTVALGSKEAFQAIRALPGEAGSATIFTHRIIHWGSRGRKGYHTPRLAVSWGCADDAYEPSYFSRKHLPYPPMALRAALACGQMLAYHERFSNTKRQLSLYYKFFNLHIAEFHESYRAKVALEFVAATKELMAAAQLAAAAGTGEPQVVRAANGKRNGKQVSTTTVIAQTHTTMKKKKKNKSEEEQLGKNGLENGVAGGSGTAPHGPVTEALPQRDKRDVEEEARSEEKKKKKRKRRASESGADADATATAGTVATGGAGEAVAAPASKKAAKKAAKEGRNDVTGYGSASMAAGDLLAGKEALAGRAKANAAYRAGRKANKRAAGKEAAAAGTGAAARVGEAATGPGIKERDGKAAEGLLRGNHEGSDSDDGDGEEEGPGWEALLQGADGGGGFDSEDEVMEDALDALLDAKLAGRLGELQDDYDDFKEDM